MPARPGSNQSASQQVAKVTSGCERPAVWLRPWQPEADRQADAVWQGIAPTFPCNALTWLTASPALLSPNAACADCRNTRGGTLVACREDGQTTLSDSKSFRLER